MDKKELYKQYLYAQYQKSQQNAQALNSPPKPDAADKAAAPSDTAASPVMDRLKNLLKTGAGYYQAAQGGILKGESLGYLPDQALPQSIQSAMAENPKTTSIANAIGEGAVGAAAGAALAPALPEMGIAGVASRMAANTGITGLEGYLKKPNPGEDRLENAMQGAKYGAIGSAVGEGLSGLGRLAQTGYLAGHPTALRDIAKGRLEDAAGALEKSEAQNLSQALEGQKVSVDTTQIRGLLPEVDEMLYGHATKLSPYGDIPSQMSIPASDAQKIKVMLDKAGGYTNPTFGTPEAMEQGQRFSAAADSLRPGLRSVNGASDIYDRWSQNLNDASKLSKMADRKPITQMASFNPDKEALFERAAKVSGVDLPSQAEQVSAATDFQRLMKRPNAFSAAEAGGQSLGEILRGALGGSVPVRVSDPRLAQPGAQLLQSLFKDQNNQ